MSFLLIFEKKEKLFLNKSSSLKKLKVNANVHAINFL